MTLSAGIGCSIFEAFLVTDMYVGLCVAGIRVLKLILANWSFPVVSFSNNCQLGFCVVLSLWLVVLCCV